MAAKDIVIYTTAFCPYCRGAKELLEKKGTAFKEISVDGDKAARQVMSEKAGGRTSVPQIFLGEAHIGGCSELYALDKDGKLDPLLKEIAG